MKAGFQGRRSYSEMAEGAGYAGASSPWLQAEAATLPKPRAYGGELYGPGRPLSPRRAFEGIRLRFEKQPSEEEEWAVPASPPSPEAGAIRCASFCAGFPIPESPAATAYVHAEHAQSWPSINVSAHVRAGLCADPGEPRPSASRLPGGRGSLPFSPPWSLKQPWPFTSPAALDWCKSGYQRTPSAPPASPQMSIFLSSIKSCSVPGLKGTALRVPILARTLDATA